MRTHWASGVARYLLGIGPIPPPRLQDIVLAQIQGALALDGGAFEEPWNVSRHPPFQAAGTTADSATGHGCASSRLLPILALFGSALLALLFQGKIRKIPPPAEAPTLISLADLCFAPPRRLAVTSLALTFLSPPDTLATVLRDVPA
ncbi:hypothetical protein BJV78DRAFT_1156272 [Lactifluus subvellereus]|nr:hypothetical protein BJV78DRAFT_1156272 [Lactifluus subvellereus]